jgi:predicted amidohydrolase YtcJ
MGRMEGLPRLGPVEAMRPPIPPKTALARVHGLGEEAIEDELEALDERDRVRRTVATDRAELEHARQVRDALVARLGYIDFWHRGY